MSKEINLPNQKVIVGVSEKNTTSVENCLYVDELFIEDVPAKLKLNNQVNKNYLINPDFNIWQRGTSFNTTGYTADRWRLTIGTGAAVTVSRQEFALGQTDVPNNPRYFLRVNRTTAGSTPSFIEQRIEDVRSLFGSGNDCLTITMYAKSSTDKTLRVDLVQNFGIGGSSQTEIESQTINVDSTWKKYIITFSDIDSISGKTLGSSPFLGFRIIADSSQGAFSFDISHIKIESGYGITNWQHKTLEEEMEECFRYFQRISPNSLSTSVFCLSGSMNTTTSGIINIRFLSKKRAIPSLSFSSFSHITLISTNASKVVSDISSFGISRDGITLLCTVSSGWSAGQSHYPILNTSSAYIDVDAEL